ncbi:uncharacterized protein LOC144875034 [Branchiostoma floridae x Branchiostoma japonicum]
MMRVPTPKPKRSGRVSMATLLMFMGVAVLLILIQPAAAERPERSLLAILEDEDGAEEILDTAGEVERDGEHVRVARSLLWIFWGSRGRCPCVRYCTRRSCSGWWWRRRCSETRYCCQRKCQFSVH